MRLRFAGRARPAGCRGGKCWGAVHATGLLANPVLRTRVFTKGTISRLTKRSPVFTKRNSGADCQSARRLFAAFALTPEGDSSALTPEGDSSALTPEGDSRENELCGSAGEKSPFTKRIGFGLRGGVDRRNLLQNEPGAGSILVRSGICPTPFTKRIMRRRRSWFFPWQARAGAGTGV